METAALGAAYLAGLASGALPAPEVFAGRLASGRRFTSMPDAGAFERKYRGWKEAVRRTLPAN